MYTTPLFNSSAGRWFSCSASNGTVPPDVPPPVARHAGLYQHRPAELLGTGRDVERVQALAIGRAASPWSWPPHTTCCVAGSITGVPVIPISGAMSQHSPVSPDGTVVTPAAGLMKLTLPERLRAQAVGVERIDASRARWRRRRRCARPGRECSRWPRRAATRANCRRGRKEASFPNVADGHVRGRQHGFVQVLAGPGVVVVMREHARMRRDVHRGIRRLPRLGVAAVTVCVPSTVGAEYSPAAVIVPDAADAALDAVHEPAHARRCRWWR